MFTILTLQRVLSTFLQRENEVGDGLSLIYPPEVVEAICAIYPADVCNYKPWSRKVRGMKGIF